MTILSQVFVTGNCFGIIYLGTAVVVLLENTPVMLSVEGAKAESAVPFPMQLV